MFQHLLVPLDGSELAEKALPVAKALAEKFDGRITLVRALVGAPTRAPEDADPDAHDRLFDQMRERLKGEITDDMARYAAIMVDEGFRTDVHLAWGQQPADAILQTADDLNVDAIVICTHGRGGMSRWMFGSVADEVLRQANVPVVVVRDGENEE